MKKFFIVLALFVFVAAFSVGSIAVNNSVRTENVYKDDDPLKKDASVQETSTPVAGQHQKDSTCIHHKESSCANKKADNCSKSTDTKSPVADEKK